MSLLSKNFIKAEFECKCGCGLMNATNDLIIKLQLCRDILEMPIIISSGCRCSSHNVRVGGSATSMHQHGQAVDIITPDDRYRYLLVRAAICAGFSGLKIYPRHMHLDTRSGDEIFLA